MRQYKINYFVMTFMVFISFMSLATLTMAKEVDDVIKQVLKKYESLDKVSATYTQTFHWKLADETQVIHGRIDSQNGLKFRVDTEDQLIVTDGKVVWTLDKLNKQIMIDYANNNTQENPFLKSFFQKYTQEYNVSIVGEEKIGEIQTIHLLFQAKSEDQFIRSQDVWIDKDTFIMKRMKQVDLNDNTTIYDVILLDVNPKFSKDQFTVHMNDEYEIIDLR